MPLWVKIGPAVATSRPRTLTSLRRPSTSVHSLVEARLPKSSRGRTFKGELCIFKVSFQLQQQPVDVRYVCGTIRFCGEVVVFRYERTRLLEGGRSLWSKSEHPVVMITAPGKVVLDWMTRCEFEE